MKVLKIRNLFITAILIILLILSFFAINFIAPRQQIAIRNIDVNSIGILSYSGKVDKLLSQFDEYEAIENDSQLIFEGSVTLQNSSQLTTKRYRSELDIENNTFYVIIQYIQDDTVISEEKIETIPKYNESTNDYYLIMPDGTGVSLAETLFQDNLDECLAVTATVVGAGAAVATLFAVSIVALAPTITTTVTTVVTTIVTWVKSFLSWFKSLFTAKSTTVVQQTITTTMTPSFTFAGAKCETRTLTDVEIRNLPKNNYYICFADSTTSQMYFSFINITREEAIYVMKTPLLIPCIGNSNRDMIFSVYTFKESEAFSIAEAAGIASLVPEKHGIGYFMHYHSIFTITTRQGDLARPHAFYELPVF